MKRKYSSEGYHRYNDKGFEDYSCQDDQLSRTNPLKVSHRNPEEDNK